MLTLLLELLAPARCAACGQAAGPALGEVGRAFCAPCGAQAARLDARPVEDSYMPFAYAGPVKAAVRRAKYQRDDSAASALGALLGALAPKELRGFSRVAPVPVGARRLRERGFDQAAVMAHEVARALRVSVAPTLLRRAKETAPLSRMAHEARGAAIAGAFVGSPAAAGQAVILVDDVFTTGATAGEARAALRVAGAPRVFLLCVAFTPRLYPEARELPGPGGGVVSSGA